MPMWELDTHEAVIFSFFILHIFSSENEINTFFSQATCFVCVLSFY